MLIAWHPVHPYRGELLLTELEYVGLNGAGHYTAQNQRGCLGT